MRKNQPLSTQALIHEGVLTIEERTALHTGNTSVFSPKDVDWKLVFDIYDGGWEKNRVAQMQMLDEWDEDRRPKTPRENDVIKVDKSPAFAGCAAEIIKEAKKQKRRVAFLFLSRFVCDVVKHHAPIMSELPGTHWYGKLGRLKADADAAKAHGVPTFHVRYEDVAGRPTKVTDALRAWLPALGAIDTAKSIDRRFVFGQGAARSSSRGPNWKSRLSSIASFFAKSPPTLRELCANVPPEVAPSANHFGYKGRSGSRPPLPEPLLPPP